MSLSLRPHHVLCCIGFAGRGYDAPFTANMANIVNGQLRASRGVELRIYVTWRADAICAPCPMRAGLDCQWQASISRLDDAHAQALDLRAGQVLTWGECLDRVRDRVQPQDLDRICATCRWLPLGICKANLAALLAGENRSAAADRPDGAALPDVAAPPG